MSLYLTDLGNLTHHLNDCSICQGRKKKGKNFFLTLRVERRKFNYLSSSEREK